MGRCVYCHSVVTKEEDYCYVCGDTVPPHIKSKGVKRQSVSGLTNLIFLASLAFTAYCFFGPYQLSLSVTLVISSTLLIIRILAEQLTKKNSH